MLEAIQHFTDDPLTRPLDGGAHRKVFLAAGVAEKGARGVMNCGRKGGRKGEREEGLEHSVAWRCVKL